MEETRSKKMTELLESMAGVKLGRSVTIPNGMTVNGTNPATNGIVFCATPGQTVVVEDIDVEGGFLIVRGPDGQRGNVPPYAFPGAKTF